MKYKIYDGISQLNNKEEIVAILNTNVNNTKLGKLFHTITIIPKNIQSLEELFQKDNCICGDCPLRRNEEEKRICYVPYYYLWNCIKWSSDNTIPFLDINNEKEINTFKKFHFVDDYILRNGNYGDSASLPSGIRKRLYQIYEGRYIDYTHSPSIHFDPNLALASCETIKQKELLNEIGWRTARIIEKKEDKLQDEKICPNNINKKITCSSCKLCILNNSKHNIAFIAHGIGKKYFTELDTGENMTNTNEKELLDVIENIMDFNNMNIDFLADKFIVESFYDESEQNSISENNYYTVNDLCSILETSNSNACLIVTYNWELYENLGSKRGKFNRYELTPFATLLLICTRNVKIANQLGFTTLNNYKIVMANLKNLYMSQKDIKPIKEEMNTLNAINEKVNNISLKDLLNEEWERFELELKELGEKKYLIEENVSKLIIEKAELENKLQNIINQIKLYNKDTTKISSEIDNYKKKLDAIKVLCEN